MNIIEENLIFDANKLSYRNNPKEIILNNTAVYNYRNCSRKIFYSY